MDTGSFSLVRFLVITSFNSFSQLLEFIIQTSSHPGRHPASTPEGVPLLFSKSSPQSFASSFSAVVRQVLPKMSSPAYSKFTDKDWALRVKFHGQQQMLETLGSFCVSSASVILCFTNPDGFYSSFIQLSLQGQFILHLVQVTTMIWLAMGPEAHTPASPSSKEGTPGQAPGALPPFGSGVSKCASHGAHHQAMSQSPGTRK